jgi:hypothetical protein
MGKGGGRLEEGKCARFVMGSGEKDDDDCRNFIGG